MQTNVITGIADAVSSYYSIPAESLFANTRQRGVTDKRAIFHYLCHKHTDLSLKQIGAISVQYGGRAYNHATVIHNIKKSKNLVKIDKRFAIDLLHIDAYVTKNVIIKKEREVLVNHNIQLMLERWFEQESREYLECLSSIAEILHREEDLGVIKNWIGCYEGVHQIT
jgi:hypothetical protein